MATVESAERLVSLPPIIETRLRDVRRRESRLRLMTGLVDATSLFLVVMFVALVCDWAFTLFSTEVRLVLTLGTVAAGVVGLLLLAFLPQLKRRTLSEVAADVDRSVSQLQERWQTVAELSTSNDSRQVVGSPAMARRVVREAIAREQLVDSRAIVSVAALKKHQWFLVAAIGAHLALYLVDGPQAWVLLKRFMLPTENVSLTQVTAVGGDFAVAHGEPVRLEAAVAKRNHDEAQLFLRDAGGKISTISVAAADKDGSRFAYAIDAADKGFDYRFRAGDGETAWHTVSVHERPTLTNINFRIVSPEYTKLPVVEKQELPRKIRAVEGSELEIVFTADQPLSQFRLDFGKDESTTLEPSATDPQQYLFRTTLSKTIHLTPVLMSRNGLENLRPPSCQIIVYQDRAPQVQIVTPDNEISVRPDDQVTIEIAARDDFAIVDAVLEAYIGDAPDMENAIVIEPPVETPAASSTENPASATTDQPVGSTGETNPSEASQTGTDQAPSATQNPAEAAKETSATPATEKPAEGSSESAQSKSVDPSSPSDSKSNDSKPNDSKSENADPNNANSNDAKDASPGNQPNDNKPGANAATNQSPDGKSGDSARSTPPNTVVMRIPLNAQKGEKNVRAKVTLDVSQFKLKTGQQLQYRVRVTDSRNATAQNRDQNANAANQKPSDMLAQRDAGQGSQSAAQPADAQRNAAGDAATAPNKTDDASGGQRSPGAQKSAQSGGTASPNANNKSNSQSANSQAQNQSSAANSQQAAQSPDKNAKQDPSQQNDTQSSSSSSQANSSKKSSDQQSNSKGGMTGAPRPQDKMTRRELDVTSQSTSSSAMKIHIDEWAGTFKGQQREKLELLIDPILQELDAVLAKSLEQMAPVAGALSQSKPLDDDLKKSLLGAETQIERGQTLVADLVKKTTDTPYAFVGLTLVDITELHVAPARVELKAVNTDAADKQSAHVNQAQFHVTRAREMLANLTKKYDEAKRDAKLAEKMQRIQKMYQIFIEDSLAFMNAQQRGTLNPKDRRIAELELDEEFLERYTELQKRWNEILAELAKALGEDPRLLERYMNSSRRSATTLRDQLTLLNRRQQVLAPTVDRLMGKVVNQNVADGEKPAERIDVADPQPGKKGEKAQPAAADIVRGSLQQDLAEISTDAADLQENVKTWLPKAVKADDDRIAPLIKHSIQVATTAEQATAVAEIESLDAASKKVVDLSTQLTEFEQALAKLAQDGDATLATHTNRRLADLRRLQGRVSTWQEKSMHLNEGRINRAIEVDQHRLTEDTLELSGKLDNLQAQLAALPQDILDLAGGLQEILKFDVLVDQMQAELTLREEDLPTASEHQQNAVKNLERAEEQFDKLIDRVIEEGDKEIPEVPDLDQMRLQTLEELLAELENEPDLAEALGIPNRPTNLQQLRDFLNRMNGAGSVGSMRQQMANQARQDALRAIQQANTPEGAELPTKKAGRWNTLSSRLEDILRQGRGNMPPKQYRRAIEQYFEDISGAEGSAE